MGVGQFFYSPQEINDLRHAGKPPRSYGKIDFMTESPPTLRIGYTRHEFNRIFQVYSRNVYTGLFRDFSFIDLQGRYFISFRVEAGATPLVTIEKRRLGPDRALFVATTPGPRGTLRDIARSEKIEIFAADLSAAIDRLRPDIVLPGHRTAKE